MAKEILEAFHPEFDDKTLATHRGENMHSYLEFKKSFSTAGNLKAHAKLHESSKVKVPKSSRL